jgi:hypothetical protein
MAHTNDRTGPTNPLTGTTRAKSITNLREKQRWRKVEACRDKWDFGSCSRIAEIPRAMAARVMRIPSGTASALGNQLAGQKKINTSAIVVAGRSHRVCPVGCLASSS